MADADSTYKGYLLMETGSHPGTWGTELNDNVISVVDVNLGGITTKSLSNSDVILSVVESANACLRFTGVLAANVGVTASGQGFYLVENLCTGSFALTLGNGITGVVIPQGYRCLVFADATNGMRIFGLLANNVALGAVQAFPLGTKTLFAQAAVPTGWTLDSTWNNYGLKISSTAGAVTSGNNGFTSTFGQTTTGNHTVTLAEYPSHQHSYTATARTTISGTVAHADWNGRDSTVGTPTAAWSTTGNSTAHAHTVDLRLQYMTTIVGTRAT